MRCFIAIELPDTVREQLRAIQEQLQPLGKAVRWTKPEQIHLTVKFLGEVPDDQIAQVCTAACDIARRHPQFDLDVRGAGCFPPRGLARVLWAGIPSLPEPLLACQSECEETFAGIGFERENRAYSPHLTLGRVNDPGVSNRVRDAIKACESFTAGTMRATELVVFQSELRPGGPVYTPLARAPLGT